MNSILSTFLRKAYRKEPISSLCLLFGAVNAVIGGVEQRWSLLSVGISVILLAFLLRLLQTKRTKLSPVAKKNKPGYLLPPSESRPPLPHLVSHPNRK
ncbi:MAG: hypothetical protein D6756_10295 [Cyanobacteria bacterium J083]|nr:MAG: hypothetical protein D6756_10295 [Cyanobacteria bacterium J083]